MRSKSACLFPVETGRITTAWVCVSQQLTHKTVAQHISRVHKLILKAISFTQSYQLLYSGFTQQFFQFQSVDLKLSASSTDLINI